MKKEEKKTSAPKWGTIEWTLAYPFSTMDRKRRARAIKAVGEDFMKEFRGGPFTCCLQTRLETMMDKYHVTLAKADKARFDKALHALAEYETGVYDAVFAAKLAQVWGVEA